MPHLRSARVIDLFFYDNRDNVNNFIVVLIFFVVLVV